MKYKTATPHLIPGTNVLLNKAGITKQKAWNQAAERSFVGDSKPLVSILNKSIAKTQTKKMFL